MERENGGRKESGKGVDGMGKVRRNDLTHPPSQIPGYATGPPRFMLRGFHNN